MKRFIFILFITITSISLTQETFQSLVTKSKKLNTLIPFPTHTNKIDFIAENNEKVRQTITQQAHNTRPIIHSSVINLIDDFLVYKRQYGSPIEQKLYCEMNSESFINRLLSKRPLMFMTSSDIYLLRNGQRGNGKFETIGTEYEQYPLLLNDYLSYDEMQISTFIGISGPTYFINTGNRNNQAIPEDISKVEKEGIYTGIVGARFEKPGLMEWQHMIITPQQNTTVNGYGLIPDKENPKTKFLSIWSKFYGESFPTFSEVEKDKSQRYIKINAHTYLDSKIYKKRIKTVIESFLVDAHMRAQQMGKKAYCHLVGIGLGVWEKTKEQAQLMLDVYSEILENKNLSAISDINFSWFPPSVTLKNCKNGFFKNSINKIKIHFSHRSTAEKLIDADEGKLLVAMYAWDGNAFPGNEYWAGQLAASGDPAAACCSTIAELHNPLINNNVSSAKLLVI